MPRKRNIAQEEQQQEPVAAREPGEDPSEHFIEPNPRDWASNNAAGVEYLTRRDPDAFLIRFKEKPPQDVIDYLHDNDFRWNSGARYWARPIGKYTAAQDRETGRRAYGKVVAMLLKHNGITAEETQDQGIGF